MTRARAWLGQLIREPLLRNASYVASGTTLGYALVFLSLPVLARLYSPKELGALGVYSSILSITLVASMLGMEQVVPIPRSPAEARSVFSLAFWILIGSSAVSVAAVVAWRGSIASTLNNGLLDTGLLLLPVSLFGGGLYLLLSQWGTRTGGFKKMGITRFTQRLAQVLVQVLGGMFVSGAVPLFVGDALGRSLGSGSLWTLQPSDSGRLRWHGMIATFKRYSRFAYLYVPGALADVGARQLPSIFLSTLYSAREAGFYAVTQSSVAIPFTVLGAAISQAYVHDAAKQGIADPRQLPALVRRTSVRLLQFGLPVVSLLCLPAPWSFPLALGEGWRTAGVFAALSYPMIACQFVVIPLTNILVILERQGIVLVLYLGELVVTLLAFVGAAALGLSAAAAVALFSVGMAVVYVATWLVVRGVVRRVALAGTGTPGQVDGSMRPASGQSNEEVDL